MAKLERKEEITYCLHLTDEETRYLKGLLQNYLGPHPIEPIPQNKMREEIWNALDKLK